MCRDCYGKKKDTDKKEGSNSQNEDSSETDKEQSSEPEKEQSNERKMFSGDWKCGGCGVAITELPFEPRDTGNLKCLDCFKKSKAN